MLLHMRIPPEEPGEQEGNRIPEILNPFVRLTQNRRLLVGQNEINLAFSPSGP